jgi:D-threo-aldose 1-dehydrogenase
MTTSAIRLMATDLGGTLLAPDSPTAPPTCHTTRRRPAMSTTIPTVTLGRTGLRTTRLGWGTALNIVSQRSDENLLDTMRAAFALGVRYIDTAPSYGTEDRLGALLAAAPAPDDLLLVTKCGQTDFSAGFIRDQIETSLRRLRREHLPLVLLHDCLPHHLPQVMGPGGALEALRRCQAEGLIGSIGMAVRAIGSLRFAVESDEFDCIQFPRLHTLLNQAAKAELLGPAKARNIGTLNAAPFGGNILATGAVPGALYCAAPASAPIVEAVRRMEQVCAEFGVRLPVAALAYSLAEPAVDVTVLGALAPAEWEVNVAALTDPPSREQLDAIVAAGQVDPYWLGAPDFITIPTAPPA